MKKIWAAIIVAILVVTLCAGYVFAWDDPDPPPKAPILTGWDDPDPPPKAPTV